MRKKQIKWSNIGPGYSEVKLTSWKHFIDFVYEEMLDYELYIWRGQRSTDWKLVPKLYRINGIERMAPIERNMLDSSHLERFKYATRGRRGSSPKMIEDENEWWSLGQHHGLATPLLDWSESPFVAAFFTYIDQGEKQTQQTQYRAIYALHKPSVEFRDNERSQKTKERIKNGELTPFTCALLNIDPKPLVQFIRPMSDDNQRLVNQGGLFTRTAHSYCLEDCIQKIHNENEADFALLKILVPNKDRTLALRMLNRMNINHLSLFPDLTGASNYCNLFAEIKNY